MTDFSGFKHAQLLIGDGSENARWTTFSEHSDHRLRASVNPRASDRTFILADG
ncbi:hypothetical protein ALO80_101454 [Pseudomonas caricapapayae]|nr:hypothetical protein ALO80_101454 [Pseudomonas caricapapayae]RMV94198.1 hypothetical protein ALP01_100957 [Pseudomonas caricapapayae]